MLERERKTRFITNTGVIIQGEREGEVADEDAEEDSSELVGFDCLNTLLVKTNFSYLGNFYRGNVVKSLTN